MQATKRGLMILFIFGSCQSDRFVLEDSRWPRRAHIGPRFRSGRIACCPRCSRTLTRRRLVEPIRANRNWSILFDWLKHRQLTPSIIAPAGMRCDFCACWIASFEKEAPSWGLAKAMVMQANRHKTTFILLGNAQAEDMKKKAKRQILLTLMSSDVVD